MKQITPVLVALLVMAQATPVYALPWFSGEERTACGPLLVKEKDRQSSRMSCESLNTLELDSLNTSCGFEGKELPRNKPCAEVEIVCGSVADPRECGGEGEHACCHINECRIEVPQSWCDSKTLGCLKPGKNKLREVLECVRGSTPATWEDATRLCMLHHELKHAENPAWWPDCSNEASAYWTQVMCLFNFYNQKCASEEDRRTNKTFCDALLGERCTMLGAHALQTCRCAQVPPPGAKTPCPDCEKACNETAQQCFENFFPGQGPTVKPTVESFCKTHERGYCTNNPNN